jgi:hypothetical protein
MQPGSFPLSLPLKLSLSLSLPPSLDLSRSSLKPSLSLSLSPSLYRSLPLSIALSLSLSLSPSLYRSLPIILLLPLSLPTPQQRTPACTDITMKDTAFCFIQEKSYQSTSQCFQTDIEMGILCLCDVRPPPCPALHSLLSLSIFIEQCSSVSGSQCIMKHSKWIPAMFRWADLH